MRTRILLAMTIAFIAAVPLAAQPKGEPAKKKDGKVEHTLKLYPVPNGTAEALAKMLREIHDGPSIRVAAVNPNQIAVFADALTHMEIAKHAPLQPPLTDVIPLSNLDPAKTAETLRAMLGSAKAGGPFLEAHGESSALIVRGTAEQLHEVKEILIRLGEGRGEPAGVRQFNLEKGSAATLAEALQQLLPQLRDNPVKVVTPGKVGAEPPKKQPEPIKKDVKPGNKLAPISITAYGNKLIVATEDREAMAVVASLIRLLVQTECPQCEYEVIRLKHARAQDVAVVLDEAFNVISGPPKGFGGKNPFGGAPGERGRLERIRVIAEPETNAILLKANALDMLTIRSLLREIDIPRTEVEKPKVGPK